ncbi:MAG TPA: radical SAM protein [Sphingorhabdus lacus]|nr:radical SAM protein [Sphingorhabdus lacus]
MDTVLLKVASRCNLNCTYCYVFNMGDTGWERQPKRMGEATIARVVQQLGALYRTQMRPFSVVLHGGEPLMLGRNRLEALFAALHSEIPTCRIHLQTNGTLLDGPTLDLCARFGVGISISLDGPEAITDRFRVDHKGGGSFQRVLRAVERIRQHPSNAQIFSGLLAVVDPETDAREIYKFFKSIGTPSVDFLYRDGNHDELPFGKASFQSTEYGEWMCDLVDAYLADPAPPRIRVIDDMIKLILGGAAQKEGVGISDYGIVVIDTDGTISKNDTLKSTTDAGDAFAESWSIVCDQLSDVVQTAAFRDYHASQRPTAAVCRTCADLTVCGGGMPTHRFSTERGLDNPTVFCADQKLVAARLREWLKAREDEAA